MADFRITHTLSRTEQDQQPLLHHLAVHSHTGEIVHLPSGPTRRALAVFGEICTDDSWNFLIFHHTPTQTDFDRIATVHAGRWAAVHAAGGEQ